MATETIDLSGRVAIITGAAGGLGRAYALALAARGAAVVANDLGGDTRGENGSAALAQAVVEEIRGAGGRAIANADTVASKAGGEALVQTALEAFGRIDIVVNNAGNQRNARFEDLSEDDIEAVLAVHLKGAFFVTQPAFRHMKAQGYGRIILTASQSGAFGNPYRANYGAAKMGVVGLMNVLVQEAPPGVLINTVLPTASGSRMGAPGGPRVDADFIAQAMARGASFPGASGPEYVAALVTYLASERCRTTQDCFSVVKGQYARVFLARMQGWIAGDDAPSAEAIEAHFEQIRTAGPFDEPRSGLEETDAAIEAIRRSGRRTG